MKDYITKTYKMIGKRYRIEYPNGIKQEKVCIDHNLYLQVRDIEDSIEFKKQYNLLANEPWFTDKSSFAYAILNNGYFERYGDPITIKIEEIL